jgi:hypothetical protein
MRSVRWWKLLGLAGVVGVAASGAVVVRSARQRAAYTPEQVRDRLHARHAAHETDFPPRG